MSICEDAWEPGADPRGGRERRRAGRQHQRVAVLRATGSANARRCSRPAPARRACRSSTPTSWAARTSSCSTAHRSCSTEPASSSARAKQFVEDLLVVDVEPPRRRDPRRIETPARPRSHEVYEALVLGTRDYVRKNGFHDVLISLSGGVDSSLVAAVAVDALGAEHVVGRAAAVALFERGQRRRRRRRSPSGSGIRTFTVPIEPAHAAFETHARAGVRGRGARRRRREPPGAHPRQRRDDDLEQVRLDGAHDAATRARWRPATRRSTATWPAASR